MKLEVKDYMNLQKIVDSGQCFRACKLNDGWFRFVSKDKVLKVKEVQPCVFEGNWNTYWENYFDLDTNYSKIKCFDKFTKKCFDFGKGIRILKQDPWETLMSFIISQRKSIPAIKTSIERICMNFGNEIEKGVFTFPTPKQVFKANFDVLKTCGLGYRIDYIMSVSKQVYVEKINLESFNNLDTVHLLKKLQEFDGVGPKVANCIALFAYGRSECVPVDTWINKAISRYYEGVNPFEKHSKNAGIMQQYIFYYMINHK